ncbi:mitochondrial carrier protein-like protein [Boeremia exigua]|uniref:mitochondrial carrier protein-like protein n=1 Tax=Boeremia exigua TaxID=749465 RepID=UPI001E8D5A33|nr:mitochondrial carrier protein-like protein [Boeremia exigua]KAH6620535.1 mitochondrial carrier protein-like protein [Boeremia exigua]
MTASPSAHGRTGVLPVTLRGDSNDELEPQKPNKAPATGVQAAGMRAVAARMVAFYFRAPVKAFFRGRIDYMGYARAINPHIAAQTGWSWRMTTPAILAHAVRTEGWSFIPNQVLPPLLANTCIGAVLYTVYLHSLSSLHEPSSYQTKRVYPPPPPSTTFTAGLIAGAFQSIVAAPFDALQTRFRTADILDGKYKTVWHYAGHKLRSIGLQGIFAGWSLSLCKDALGAAVFFSAFETVKSQGYYSFVTWHYGTRTRDSLLNTRPLSTASDTSSDHDSRPVINPHFALEPTFLLLAGISAGLTSQTIQHPLTALQDAHFRRLEALDFQAREERSPAHIMRRYYHAYQETWRQCRTLARRAGGWRKYLYKDFWGTTVRQVPSTSAGLIVFELVRRKYSVENEGEVTIDRANEKILLR